MRVSSASPVSACPAWARGLVLFAALLAVCAWPATRIHEATVQHAVCAEHGELVDVAEESHSRDPGEGERWASAGPDEEVHEHCPFLALGQPGDPISGAPIRGARLVAAARSLPPSSVEGFASVPLLCLAPKQSPPV